MPANTHPKPTKILSKPALYATWAQSRDKRRSAGAAGTDGVSARAFAANLEVQISNISKDIRSGTFNFSKLRPVPVPKAYSDKERLICIPTVRDRLVQRCMVNHIFRKKILPIHNSSSFGFMPELGVRSAIRACIELRDLYPYVFETDIIQFFDTIPRDKLIQKIGLIPKGKSLVPLLQDAVRVEAKPTMDCPAKKIKELGVTAGKGIRQGMPLSPVLANLVLSDFDSLIEAKGIRMVRYADDIVLFAASRSDAVKAGEFLQKKLDEIGLKIPEIDSKGKTKIASQSDPIEFLGREIVFSNRVGLYIQRVSERKIEKIESALRHEFSIDIYIQKNRSFSDFGYRLGNKIGSYIKSYSDAYNASEFEQTLKQIGVDIIIDVYKQIFGTKAVRNVSVNHRQFLGIADIQISDSEIDLIY